MLWQVWRVGYMEIINDTNKTLSIALLDTLQTTSLNYYDGILYLLVLLKLLPKQFSAPMSFQ